jgi:hypothetical protein
VTCGRREAEHVEDDPAVLVVGDAAADGVPEGREMPRGDLHGPVGERVEDAVVQAGHESSPRVMVAVRVAVAPQVRHATGEGSARHRPHVRAHAVCPAVQATRTAWVAHFVQRRGGNWSHSRV